MKWRLCTAVLNLMLHHRISIVKSSCSNRCQFSGFLSGIFDYNQDPDLTETYTRYQHPQTIVLTENSDNAISNETKTDVSSFYFCSRPSGVFTEMGPLLRIGG